MQCKRIDASRRESLRQPRCRKSIPRSALALTLLVSSAGAQTLAYVDLNGAGAQTGSVGASISNNGRYVEWADLNGHVYLRDTVANTTSQVDLAWNGAQANGFSMVYGISHGVSDDGRYVIFSSGATNLLSGGDANGVVDIFMRDRVANTTIRCNVGPAGQVGNGHTTNASLSADGRYVEFCTPSTNLFPGDGNLGPDVARFDRTTGLSTLVSVSTGGTAGNGPCFDSAMSSDGRYVVFDCSASNLVASDTNGGVWDVFIRDMNTATTSIVSMSSAGVQGGLASGDATVSTDGRYVAFVSNNNFYDNSGPPVWGPVYLRDRTAGTTTRISSDTADNLVAKPDISADGTRIGFASLADNLLPGHYPGAYDAYLYDRATSTLVRVSSGPYGSGSLNGSGGTSYPALSADGRAIAFDNDSDNLVVPDQQSGVPDTFLWKAPACGKVPVAYCTAKVNSQGCYPLIDTTGTPSASMASGFVITANYVLGNVSGLFLYGHGGQQAYPFQGGYLCVVGPIRTPVQNSGASGTPPCPGTYSIDFNVRVASGVDPALVGGAAVDGQFWSRDTGFAAPNNTGLTGGIHFVLCP